MRVVTSTRPASLNALGARQPRAPRARARRRGGCRPARSRARRPCPPSSSASKPGVSFSTRKPLTWPSSCRARPHDDDVGDRAVADPALGAVEHPVVAVAARAGLERDGVRAVLGLGQRERADRLQPRHRRQPALLLLLGAEQVDRLHRQPRLDAEERAEAAVAAVQLHVHQAARERAHARAAVALRCPRRSRPSSASRRISGHGSSARLPVLVDRRQHLAGRRSGAWR